MKDEKLTEILFEIYREQYKQADPPADFDKLMETGEAFKERFFMNYYLDSNRQSEILEDIMKKYKISEYDKKRIRISYFLGCSPRG